VTKLPPPAHLFRPLLCPTGPLLAAHPPPPQSPDLTGPGLTSRLAWLKDKGFPINLDDALYFTRDSDELPALEWLIGATDAGPGAPFADALASKGAAKGLLASMERLLQRGWLAPGAVQLVELVKAAAGTGLAGVPTIVWLVHHLTGEGVPEAQRHPLTAEVFAAAAQVGSLQLLQLLREAGCPWDESVWEGAAQGGCAALLEWLHAACCPKPVSWTFMGRTTA
jgi:hypothetical protein